MSDPRATPCKGCGKPIIWATTIENSKIPLDATAPVYKLTEAGLAISVHGRGFVSHFATCSHVNDFSKTKKGIGALPLSGDELESIWQTVLLLRTFDEMRDSRLVSELASICDKYAPGPPQPALLETDA